MAELRDEQIKSFVDDWYRALDIHAPMVNILPMLAEEGLEMVFPEAKPEGQAAFEGWYERVIRSFFDEKHTVKEVTIDRQGTEYHLDVVVEWEASKWTPPAPRSQRIIADAYQRWIVRPHAASGKPVLATYIVDRMDYHPGSATL